MASKPELKYHKVVYGQRKVNVSLYLSEEWHVRFLKAVEILKERGFIPKKAERRYASTMIKMKIEEIEQGMI